MKTVEARTFQRSQTRQEKESLRRSRLRLPGRILILHSGKLHYEAVLNLDDDRKIAGMQGGRKKAQKTQKTAGILDLLLRLLCLFAAKGFCRVLNEVQASLSLKMATTGE